MRVQPIKRFWYRSGLEILPLNTSFAKNTDANFGWSVTTMPLSKGDASLGGFARRLDLFQPRLPQFTVAFSHG
jgi:hypothetical protein